MVPAAREMVTRPSSSRLAHGFQDAALEFGQFVQKQHAVVRQGNFAGRRIGVAAQQPGVAGGVMRGAERTARDQGLARLEQADDAVDFGRLQRLLQSQRRQDRGQPFGQHGFPGARRADEQHVVPARRRDFQRPLDRFLPFDFRHVNFLVVGLVENFGQGQPVSAGS